MKENEQVLYKKRQCGERQLVLKVIKEELARRQLHWYFLRAVGTHFALEQSVNLSLHNFRLSKQALLHRHLPEFLSGRVLAARCACASILAAGQSFFPISLVLDFDYVMPQIAVRPDPALEICGVAGEIL